GGGTSLGGLVDGALYTVVKVDATHVMLADGTQASFNPVTLDGTTFSVGANSFAIGQAVLYSSQGGEAIDGLEDGQVYYVHKASPEATAISLAATRADALAGTNLIGVDGSAATGEAHTLSGLATLDGTGSGERHSLSEAGALARNAVWTIDQLQNTINESILRPKAVSGTTATTEEANIVGNTITIVSAGGVGSVDSDPVVVNLNDLSSLTNEQQIALAGAERHELTFYTGLNGTGSVIANPSDPSAPEALSVVIRPSKDVDVTHGASG